MVELLSDSLKIDLPVMAGRDEVDVVFGGDWVFVVEAVVLHLQLLETAVQLHLHWVFNNIFLLICQRCRRLYSLRWGKGKREKGKVE